MRILFIAFSILTSAFATTDGDSKLNAEYAGNAAKLFTQIQSRENLVELLKAVTKPSDQKLLEQHLTELKTLPNVKAQGAKLIIALGSDIETLTVIDGTKDLFQYRGVEVDLSPERPLQDRLRQIEELADSKTSTIWDFIFPRAEALTQLGYPFAVAAVGSVANAGKEFRHYVKVQSVANRLNGVCEDFKAQVDSKLRMDFSAETEKAIDDDELANRQWKYPRKLVRNIADWQPNVLATLKRMQPEYCAKGIMHQLRKIHPDSRSYQKETACQTIEKAAKCFEGIEDRHDLTLYKIQHEEVVKWLKEIDPKVSETRLAEEVTVLSNTQTAAKPVKTKTAKSRSDVAR